METALSIALGIALSAAAGFRVFVPLLALSIGGYTDVVHLTPGFAWIGTIPSMIAFGTATIAEVGAYYVPWVDNALDTIAAPAAVIAGTVISASVITDLPPLVRWSLALMGGGGIAGILQGATAFLRLKSSTFTAGLGNPALATMELGGSVITVILGILVPAVVAGVMALLAIGIFLVARRLLFSRPARQVKRG
ncbi:MAG: DUF4126 domain-containing protein [Ignavibacteriae bacterium]|nr:DUF4126 domain-containing protein [Ignavibacteriota bacterium]